MPARRAFVIIGTGTTADGPLHCRAWEIQEDAESLEQVAETLTAAYGAPAEWMSDETGDPGQPRIVFYAG